MNAQGESARGSRNVARFLPALAAADPERLAVCHPDGDGWVRTTYGELEARSSALARGLLAHGLRRGDRVVVLAHPDRDWIALVYALFRVGAVPVLIDPGMGVPRLLDCVARVRPRGLVGLAVVHWVRRLRPGPFRTVEVAFTAGRAPRLVRGGPTLAALIEEHAGASHEPVTSADDDAAAVLFTSGSTGPAKGVAYSHGNFDAQVELLRATYGFRPGEVDLACFPLFALFGAALELTSVLPDMDFSKPALCDPAKLVAAVREHGATTTFGSPAIWRRVVPWCLERGVRLEGLRRLLIAGAPVEPALIELALSVLDPEGDVHTPYGATESLPVSSASGREILARWRGRVESGSGNCVGRPVPGIDVRLIRVTDEGLERWSDDLEVAPGEVGEVCLRGPVVTREYLFEPEATARAKIADGAGGVWHRMGDLASRDEDGCLWFLGRKAHRIETEHGTVYPVPVENVFFGHAHVPRCALVGVGRRGAEKPVLVVEDVPGVVPRERAARAALAAELMRPGAGGAGLAGRKVEAVLFERRFPLDVRHNAKIDREELKRRAEARLR